MISIAGAKPPAMQPYVVQLQRGVDDRLPPPVSMLRNLFPPTSVFSSLPEQLMLDFHRCPDSAQRARWIVETSPARQSQNVPC
jgi:hypothetical protein